MKKIIHLIVFLLLLQLASAGVSHPNRLTLTPGEEGEFSFAVDAVTSSTPLLCKIEFASQTSLKIKFDKTETRIEPGRRVFIKGEVKAPRNIPPGSYKETFCVACDRISTEQGAVTRPRYCDIPIRVNIEESIKEESPLSIPKNISWIISLVIINLLLIIFIIFLFLRQKKSEFE